MRAAIALLLLGGCNAILGIGDVKSSSGGPDAPIADAPPNAGCPPSSGTTIVGCWFDDYIVSKTSTLHVARDLSHLQIQAWLSDGTKLDAIMPSPGVFTIDPVPAQDTYALRVLDQDAASAGPTFYMTDRRDLDLGSVIIGRPDGTPVTKPKTVTFQMSNMSSWTDADYLLIDSFGVDTENFVGVPAGSASNLPVAGDTASDVGINWQNSYGFNGSSPKLVDGGKGDDVWVTHDTGTPVNDSFGHPLTASKVVDAFTSNAIAMSDDSAPLTVTGAFTAVAPTTSETFSFAFSDLRNGLGDEQRYTDETIDCAMITNIAASYGNNIGPALVEAGGDSTTNGTLLSEATISVPAIAYGNPYPADWDRTMDCSISHSRFFKVPGATKAGARGSALVSIDSVNGTSYTFKTQGHPPSNITIAGKPALPGGAIAFSPTAPVTVTWSAVPMTDMYSVHVAEASIDAGKTIFLPIATFDTSDTTLAIPAELFTDDHFYEFEIVDLRQTASYTLGHLARLSTPHSLGEIASGLFRFSTACGNGTKEGSEQCDTAGDSATCDADCSLPVCGDGYLNAAANEQCDDVGDSPRCNGATCKLSACGDGHLNIQAGEQCDDGNKVNGDGCSAGCQPEAGWTCDGASPTVCTPG